MPRPAVAPPESTVETACPLDCPDACSLTVTLRGGRITKIDGGTANEVTRRLHLRQGAALRSAASTATIGCCYPAIRRGAKGEGKFVRATWDDALDTSPRTCNRRFASTGGEAVLPLCYGGSNGMLTQDYADAILFRRLGHVAAGCGRCARRPTGAANMALYGKMASVVYQDYPAARLILLWGVNPAASGIHLMPYLKEARDSGATIVVDRSARHGVARQADIHLAVASGHRRRGGPGHPPPSVRERRRRPGVPRRAHHRRRAAARAGATVDLRARRRGQRRAPPIDLERWRALYARSSPALVKCGWGLERNRNGGSAAAAVLALPAVGGKFGCAAAATR